MVKRPYTVVEVGKNAIYVQACKLIAPVYHCCGDPYLDRPDLEGQRVFFFNTKAEFIEPNPDGEIEKLVWHFRREMWGTDQPESDYPQFAVFGKYEHQPYLD